ncbi:lysozyme [Pedobacter sp. BS3]|uniref:lysozyme n=1 Tax=Pedobacter sp. BS3 TaxID=2567937 RepID=UPI0011F063CD|nr:lysozyme [Pedobacter sp. BS3]TZF81815.1 lysozyme [Pedobacter sp. BS3]
MKIDIAGKTFLFNEEGLRLKAYKDSAGVWTIGIGCTYYPDGRKVKEGDTISKEQAYNLFDNVVRNYEAAVNNGVRLPLTQNQFNALVSFCYNVGVAGFSNSTLLQRINSRANEEQIRQQFNRWITAGGQVSKTLVERRKREANLFFKP